MVEHIFEYVWRDAHWVIFLLLLGTCYYSRGVSEKSIFRNPGKCMQPSRKSYTGDGIFYQFHRYIFWLAFLIVIGFIVNSLIGLPEFFVSEEVGPLQHITKVMEILVAFIFLFYLLGCHHLRYVLGAFSDRKIECKGCFRRKIYKGQKRFNGMHDTLFWFGVAGVILLHVFFVFGGHV